MTPLRPSISSEVRAWILAGVLAMTHTIAIVWWAATLNAKFDSMKDLLVANSVQYKELELRVRELELNLSRETGRRP